MIAPKLNIINTATKWMKMKSKVASQTTSKALIASGFELMGAMKKGMKKEAPGGIKWPTTSPWVKYNLIGKGKRRQARRTQKVLAGKKVRSSKIKKINLGKPKTALAKLIPANRVKKWVNLHPQGQGIRSTKVHAGFISSSSAYWANYHATGPHTVPVTKKMRRMFYAIGLILTASRIKIPKRQIVQPTLKRNAKTIPVFINRRVERALQGKDPKQVKMTWH
jgi:hypothetical protein